MNPEFTNTMLPFITLLLGIFAGFWFKNINKKTDLSTDNIHENLVKINKIDDKLAALKESSAKTEIAIKEDMLGLIKDMREMTKVLTNLGITVGKHQIEIENLKQEHGFIAKTLREDNGTKG